METWTGTDPEFAAWDGVMETWTGTGPENVNVILIVPYMKGTLSASSAFVLLLFYQI